MRVAAHAATVFDGWDPIGGNRLFYGSGVTHAARIEPRMPEGEVYVTHPFAAQAVLEGERGFECKYVGTIRAAKGYESVSLYSLHARSRS
jgi:adenylate cyclase